MTARLQLQIQGTSDFAFDVEGEWIPSIEPIYKEAAQPPELAELRHTWEFRGCRIVSSDNTTATLWDEFQAFLAYFEDRTAHPTYVQLVRDPSGAAAVEWKLDGSTYEQLRFELIEGQTDALVPDSSWNTSALVTLRVSAVRKFADANGVVDFAQRVLVSYDAGLRTLEWQTRIVTAEGTSAVTKAQTYAAIDITALSAGYCYTTNGPDGIDYEVIDADEGASRTPTIVEAISRVREFNAAIGASGGGVAPDEVELVVTTTTSDTETITTTEAFARGPNASVWVSNQKPTGQLSESETVNRSSHNEYRGRWVRRTSRPNAGSGSTVESNGHKLSVAVSGGLPVARARAVPGFLPLIQKGATLPWVCVVTVEARDVGEGLTNSDMPLPGALPSPWVLDPTRSEESEPVIEKHGADPSQHQWLRTAKLTYLSAKKPTKSPLEQLRQAATVPTYHL